MINYRFLNYKTRNAFLRDKDNIREDAVVFIQEGHRIWTHNEEYICDNQSLQQLQAFQTYIEQILNNKADKVDLTTKADKSELEALRNSKADKTDLDYLRNTKADKTDLDGKQDKLTAGYGINISQDNIIEVVLDTTVYVLVDELPESNIDPNKIYLKSETANGKTILVGYKYVNGEWISMGEKEPSVDLTPYATKRQLSELIEQIEKKYVQKKDVYTPSDTDFNGDDIADDTPQINQKLVTLTVSQYQSLVDSGMVQSDTYYFTYEGEEQENNHTWTFGDNFPVIFTSNWVFGGTFPVILT